MNAVSRPERLWGYPSGCVKPPRREAREVADTQRGRTSRRGEFIGFARHLFRCACSGAAGVVTAAAVVALAARWQDAKRAEADREARAARTGIDPDIHARAVAVAQRRGLTPERLAVLEATLQRMRDQQTVHYLHRDGEPA